MPVVCSNLLTLPIEPGWSVSINSGQFEIVNGFGFAFLVLHAVNAEPSIAEPAPAANRLKNVRRFDRIALMTLGQR